MSLPERIEGTEKIFWATALLDENGNPYGVKNTNGQIHVLAIEGATEAKQDDIITELQKTVRVLDSNNSTSANLGNGGEFIGEWIDVLNYSSLSVEIKTDQLSAIDGFKVESSNDASTVNHTHSVSILAGTNHHYTFTLTGKYYRIRYINGVTPTLALRIGSSLSKVDQSHQHTHSVEFVITSDHPADLVRSVLTAKRADNAYSNIRSTNGNNLKISLEEYDETVNPIRKDMEGLGKVPVGTTAVEVEFTGTPTNVIKIKADKDNTGLLFIGKSNVTNAGANALDYLDAGDEIIIDYNDVDNAVYVVSDTASQNFWAGALL